MLWTEREADVTAGGGPGGAATGSAVLSPAPGPITIALGGDVTGGASLAERLGGPPGDLLGPLAEVIGTADLAVVDLDAAVTDDPAGDRETGAVPGAVLGALRAAGVDVVSAANDRSLDLGAGALLGAVAAVEDGPAVIGVGADEGSAYRPFVRDVGGHTVAVIAATQLLDPDRIASDTAGSTNPGVASAKRVDRLLAEVAAVRAEADIVVVYLHWGTAGETCPDPSQQELAAALVGAGADVVAGPGAGRSQGAGRSGDALVGYGLGTLLGAGPEGADAGVLLVRVDGQQVLSLDWVPAGLGADGLPAPLTEDEATAARADWESRRACTDLTP